MNDERVGLLVSRDLIFTTRVTSTARELGKRVLVAGSAELAASMIEQWQPALVLIDLSAGEASSPQAILAYRQATKGGSRLIAFGSHVDKDALASAAAAGCDEVMPRSKFSAELPDLIVRCIA